MVATAFGAVNSATIIEPTAGTVGWAHIESQTASASPEIDFAFPSGHVKYRLHIMGAQPATGGVDALCQWSNDAGVSFRTGATDYDWVIQARNASGSDYSEEDATANSIFLNGDAVANAAVGNNAIVPFEATLDIFSARDSSQVTRLQYSCAYTDSLGNLVNVQGWGQGINAEDVDAMRFTFSSGNITKGTFVLEGLVE